MKFETYIPEKDGQAKDLSFQKYRKFNMEKVGDLLEKRRTESEGIQKRQANRKEILEEKEKNGVLYIKKGEL